MWFYAYTVYALWFSLAVCIPGKSLLQSQDLHLHFHALTLHNIACFPEQWRPHQLWTGNTVALREATCKQRLLQVWELSEIMCVDFRKVTHSGHDAICLDLPPLPNTVEEVIHYKAVGGKACHKWFFLGLIRVEIEMHEIYLSLKKKIRKKE